MLDIPEPYNEVTNNLSPILYNLPGKVVAIDGKNGSGKTTLGRYLAWFYNVTLIETDLFRFQDNTKLKYKEEEIKNIIRYRLNSNRPVIIEGVALKDLLGKLEIVPEYTIYIENEAYERDDWLVDILKKYEEEQKPKESSNIVIELNVL